MIIIINNCIFTQLFYNIISKYYIEVELIDNYCKNNSKNIYISKFIDNDKIRYDNYIAIDPINEDIMNKSLLNIFTDHEIYIKWNSLYSSLYIPCGYDEQYDETINQSNKSLNGVDKILSEIKIEEIFQHLLLDGKIKYNDKILDKKWLIDNYYMNDLIMGSDITSTLDKYSNKKFYFVIGAIFKNEAHILDEWIRHYQFHGIEHIYLINDNSSDNYLDILKPYIDDEYVTLFQAEHIEQKVNSTQMIFYNRYFNKDIRDKTTWFGIFDLDEFLYCVDTIDIKRILRKYDTTLTDDIGCIHSDWVHFGSNGFKKQPQYVVPNFIMRSKYNRKLIARKSISKMKHLRRFSLHSHVLDSGRKINISINNKGSVKEPVLLINHYKIQSEQFWRDIKMTRGDMGYYAVNPRDMEMFKQLDINDVKDTRLYEQNKSLY